MPSDPLPRIDPTLSSCTHLVEPLQPRDDVVRGPVRLVLASDLMGAEREIKALLADALKHGLAEAMNGVGLGDLERAFAVRWVAIAQRFLALLFATACWEAMRKDLAARGLQRGQIRIRSDRDGYATIHTTFGRITFPVFAYADLTGPALTIRHPARTVLPYHRACRSSPLCLEWEARLGAQHPFRKAEELFRFFSRGTSTIEDTTIERHMLYLGRMVDPSWLYRTPDDIARILRERAKRDKTTGRPLVYFSTDAHALRRFVDLTWTKQWKMVNGIRVWCEDAKTGKIIHLGGEFLWGDCEAIESRIRELLKEGILPDPNHPAWRCIQPQLVFISDGAEWFVDRILPLVPDAVVVLDYYHLLDWFSEFGKLVFGASTGRNRQFHADVRQVLLQRQVGSTKAASKERKGHKKRRPGQARTPHAHQHPRHLKRGRPRTVLGDATGRQLLDLLDDVRREISELPEEHAGALEALVDKVAKNVDRIDYPVLLARGLQIGSGAMESLHRSGSQLRLKLPGATWLEETSQVVIHFRMLELSGRWDEFWKRRDLAERISLAFHGREKHPTLAVA